MTFSSDSDAQGSQGDLLTLIRAGVDLRSLESRLRILAKAVEQSPASIIITDSQGIIEYVNPKFTQVTGYAPEEVLGQTPRMLKGGELGPEFYQDLWRTIRSGEEWHGMFHNRTKAGTMIWELASISPIRDDAGQVTHFVCVKEDITEMKRLQDQMSQMAHHDPLTGLPNRILFYDRIKNAQAQARRRRSGFALFYLDLDGFKAVNDTHGHEKGDLLLCAVARRIGGCVRESDTVARMGGDEFTVLLPDLQGREAAAMIAGAILETLGQPFNCRDISCTIGVSIGISLFPQDGEDTDQIITRADSAMYHIKHGGRNSVAFWSDLRA
jgi:diguanylate cyclase (GGDEF)-like protein/PAS domain S-box-containing protein